MADNKKFQKQMEFLLELDKIKQIYRQTYISDKSRKENDAEHSWHTGVMAVVLAEYFPKADLLKTIKMMLFHDVVEIYAGDTYCYDKEGNADKEEREKEAAQKVYGLLPKGQKDEFISLWKEFEEGQSEEAKFASMLDRLQPTMLNDATEGKSWLEHGVKKEQVLKRNEILLKGPKVVEKYAKDIINSGHLKGYLR